MELPTFDTEYLDSKGYCWKLHSDGNEGCLIIKDFPTSPCTYDRQKTDLLIRIPPGYNQTKLDMFYVDPPLKLKVGANYPTRADSFENHCGRRWQRFSRHSNGVSWRPGVDDIRSHLATIIAELSGRVSR